MTDSEAFNDLYFAVTRVLTRGSEALPELEAAHVRATAHRREAAGAVRLLPARDKARREWKGRGLSDTDPLLAGWAFDAGWDAALAAASPHGLDDTEVDDARHITWDHGRRTLCGRQVTDHVNAFLPLGEAPSDDEGGEWCWSCLQLQAEARSALAAPVVPERGQDEAIVVEVRAAKDVRKGDCYWKGSGWGTVLSDPQTIATEGPGGKLVRMELEDSSAETISFLPDEPFLIRGVVPARPLDDTERGLLDEAFLLLAGLWNEGPRAKTGPIGDWLRERGYDPNRRRFTTAAASPHGLDDTERPMTDAEIEAERDAAMALQYSVPQDASEVAADRREEHGLDDTEVERAAKAVADDVWGRNASQPQGDGPFKVFSWDEQSEAVKDEYRHEARVALAAARSHDGQEGAREAEPTPDLDMRPFNMQDGPPIPWFLAEIIHRNLYRYSQPLEMVHKRGGFGWAEVEVLYRKNSSVNQRRQAVSEVRAALRPGPGEDERP